MELDMKMSNHQETLLVMRLMLHRQQLWYNWPDKYVRLRTRNI